MYWLAVKIDVPNEAPVDNIINVDTIVRFGPRDGGKKSYMHLVNGDSIDLVDAYPQLCDTLAREK